MLHLAGRKGVRWDTGSTVSQTLLSVSENRADLGRTLWVNGVKDGC